MPRMLCENARNGIERDKQTEKETELKEVNLFGSEASRHRTWPNCRRPTLPANFCRVFFHVYTKVNISKCLCISEDKLTQWTTLLISDGIKQ